MTVRRVETGLRVFLMRPAKISEALGVAPLDHRHTVAGTRVAADAWAAFPRILLLRAFHV